MSTKSSTSGSKKKRTGKALVITIVAIVFASVLVALSPVFLPKETAAKIESAVETLGGVDSVVNNGYKRMLEVLRSFIRKPEHVAVETEAAKTETTETPAVTATKDTQTKTLSTNRIEGLEIPAYVEDHEVIRHTGYTLSWNEKYLVADWVAYELTAAELDTQEVSRSEDFRPDEYVNNSSQLEDYKNSGYSRGHLAPAQDFKWSEKAMSDTFYLTNMVPQLQNYNGGIWLRAENATRDAARITGTVYVVTGPVLTDGPFETIGSNSVAIPKQCYKALLVIDGNGAVHTIAISIPQDAGKKETLSKYLMTVDELEELTGLDFFIELEDDIENAAEATYDIDYWPNSFR